MKEYDKRILNNLIDTYEKSSLYTGRNERNITIDFKFTEKNIPEYFDQTSSVYDDIHILMNKLEEQLLIKIVWKNKKVNYIITKVILNTDYLEEAYRYIRRTPLKSISNQCIQLLRKYQKKDEVLENFCDWAIYRIEHGQSVKRYIDLKKTQEIIDLLEGVHGVVANTKDYYIRELSILVYHDSKKLEALLGKIETLIREFHPNKDMFANTYDLIGEFNISKNPTWVMMKGTGSFKRKGTQIRLQDMGNGIGISSDDISDLIFECNEKVKEVITIENLTAYHRYQKDDTLIIYLGGFHSTARRKLLLRIYEVYQTATYLHWGDIDIGGFRIYFDLLKKTKIPFKIQNMNIETLEKYKEFGKKLTGNDKKELDYMITYIDLYTEDILVQDEVIRVLRKLKEIDRKVEQEVVLED